MLATRRLPKSAVARSDREGPRPLGPSSLEQPPWPVPRYQLMTKEERIELVTAAVSKLEEVSRLLTAVREELLADQVGEFADLVDVVAGPGEDAETAAENA